MYYEKQITKKDISYYAELEGLEWGVNLKLHKGVKVKGRFQWFVSYERNQYDKDIFAIELRIFELGIFEDFPKPDKYEIAAWVHHEQADSRVQNKWVDTMVKKHPVKTSVSQLFWNIKK